MLSFPVLQFSLVFLWTHLGQREAEKWSPLRGEGAGTSSDAYTEIATVSQTSRDQRTKKAAKVSGRKLTNFIAPLWKAFLQHDRNGWQLVIGGRGVFHGPRKIQRSLRDFNRSKQRALWSRFLGSMATNPVVGSRFVEYGGGGRWEMVETNYFWLRNRQHNLRKLTEQHGWRNVFGCTSMQYMYVRRDVYFMHVYVGLYM